MTSDHRCITFSIKTDKAPKITFRNPANTDWSTFVSEIRKSKPLNTGRISSVSDLNNSAEKLSKCLINSYYSACPPKIIKPGRSAPFFTSDLKTARRETRAAFNHAKDGDPVKVAIRRKAQSNYNKLLKRNKRTKFQQFCNSVETISGASRLFKSLSSDPACSIGTLKLPSGEFTDSPEATLHHLLDLIFLEVLTQYNNKIRSFLNF